jgi:hypothetical protein
MCRKALHPFTAETNSRKHNALTGEAVFHFAFHSGSVLTLIIVATARQYYEKKA